MPRVLKADVSELQLPAALDIHHVGRVDQNVIDRFVLEERFEWPQAEQLIQDIVDKLIDLTQRQKPFFLEEQLTDDAANFRAESLPRRLVQQAEVEKIEQAFMDLEAQRARVLYGPKSPPAHLWDIVLPGCLFLEQHGITVA